MNGIILAIMIAIAPTPERQACEIHDVMSEVLGDEHLARAARALVRCGSFYVDVNHCCEIIPRESETCALVIEQPGVVEYWTCK